MGETTITVFKTAVKYFPWRNIYLIFLQQPFEVDISIPISEMRKQRLKD